MGDDYSPALIAAPTLQYKYVHVVPDYKEWVPDLPHTARLQDCMSVHSALYTARRDNYSWLHTYRVTSHVNMGVF